jgi:uncharacterized coiled-coil protein SlyX|tara:strand:- start:280 stop:678 length:399 start_codon:yes stop_codon:yes gene_type:complete
MVELSDNTDLTIPLRNLVSIVLGVAVVTAGYADLNSRITTLEHGQSIQDMTIKENAAFVREWPLGLRGALPDDLIQNAKIMALEDRQKELQRLQERMNELQIDINKVSGINETHNEKLETLFDVWNNQLVNK